MRLTRYLKHRREQARWAKAYRDEAEYERLDALIDERSAELQRLYQALDPTSIQARYPGNVRLMGLMYGSKLESQRERVRVLEQEIVEAQRTLARKGLPAPESEAKP